MITSLVKGPLYQMRVTVHRTRDQTRTLLHNEERRFAAGNGQQEGPTGQAVLLEVPVGASDLEISVTLLDLMPGLDDDERLLASMNVVRNIRTPPDCKAEEQGNAETDGAILISAGGPSESGTRNGREAGPASHPEEVATSLQLRGLRCVAGRASNLKIGAAGLVHGIHYRFTVRVVVKLGGAQAHFEAVDFLGQGESREFLTVLPPLPENEYRLFVSIEDRHPASPDEALLASAKRLLACPFFSEGQQDGKDEPRGANSGQTRDSALRDTLLFWHSHHFQPSDTPTSSTPQSASAQPQSSQDVIDDEAAAAGDSAASLVFQTEHVIHAELGAPGSNPHVARSASQHSQHPQHSQHSCKGLAGKSMVFSRIAQARQQCILWDICMAQREAEKELMDVIYYLEPGSSSQETEEIRRDISSALRQPSLLNSRASGADFSSVEVRFVTVGQGEEDGGDGEAVLEHPPDLVTILMSGEGLEQGMAGWGLLAHVLGAFSAMLDFGMVVAGDE